MRYIDNNATTRMDSSVEEQIEDALSLYYNPSSFYKAASETRDLIENTRKTVALFLGGVKPEEIVFTSGATESNCTAIMGCMHDTVSKMDPVIVTTNVEHACIRSVCPKVVNHSDLWRQVEVGTNGAVTVEGVMDQMDDDVAMVSVIHANNETGVINPIGEIALAIKKAYPNVIVHTDATQSVGKIPVDLRLEMKNVDMLSMSAHKIHGPKGTGVLFVRDWLQESNLWSPLFGGGHQENGMRSGTENVLGIVGLGAACRFVAGAAGHYKVLKDHKSQMEKNLKENVSGLTINGEDAERLPTTTSVSIDYLEAEELLYHLDKAGICASSGSACSTGSLEPSHVILAMKVREKAVRGTVRFSFGALSQVNDFDAVCGLLPGIVDQLRKLSPYCG